MERLKDYENNLIKELDENWNEYKDKDEDTQRDWISELIDAYIPVYTYDLLEIARNDFWLATTEPELMCFDGKNTAVNAIAGNIYQHLQEKGQEWLDSKKKI